MNIVIARKILFCVVYPLAVLGMAANFIQALLLWRRDEHPLAMVLFVAILVIGIVALRPLMKQAHAALRQGNI